VTSVDSTRAPHSRSYPRNSRPNTVDNRPYDGTNGGTLPSYRSYSKKDRLSGAWALTSQQRDDSERHQAAVITHIMADRDTDDIRRDIPTDKITVTTERMVQVEIEGEGDGNSDTSAGVPEIGQRFRRSDEETASTDNIVGT